MSVNGSEESGTMRLGIPIVDHLTGYAAMGGILMALVARQRTGRGQRVEATLFDTGLSLLVPHASNWFYSGRAPRLLGSAHPNICPYDKFKAGGGEIFLGVANDGQFRRLCECIGREDLAADARFRTNPSRLENRAALRVELEKALAAREVEPLCRDLMRAGVPAGPVNTVPQAFCAGACRAPRNAGRGRRLSRRRDAGEVLGIARARGAPATALRRARGRGPRRGGLPRGPGGGAARERRFARSPDALVKNHD